MIHNWFGVGILCVDICFVDQFPPGHDFSSSVRSRQLEHSRIPPAPPTRTILGACGVCDVPSVLLCTITPLRPLFQPCTITMVLLSTITPPPLSNHGAASANHNHHTTDQWPPACTTLLTTLYHDMTMSITEIYGRYASCTSYTRYTRYAPFVIHHFVNWPLKCPA